MLKRLPVAVATSFIRSGTVCEGKEGISTLITLTYGTTVYFDQVYLAISTDEDRALM